MVVGYYKVSITRNNKPSLEDTMIIDAEIMGQPYDILSKWNSPKWTWVKFINDDFSEWCGEFRGEPRGVALSKKYNQILILTSDYLYQLDCLNGVITNY